MGGKINGGIDNTDERAEPKESVLVLRVDHTETGEDKGRKPAMKSNLQSGWRGNNQLERQSPIITFSVSRMWTDIIEEKADGQVTRHGSFLAPNHHLWVELVLFTHVSHLTMSPKLE